MDMNKLVAEGRIRASNLLSEVKGRAYNQETLKNEMIELQTMAAHILAILVFNQCEEHGDQPEKVLIKVGHCIGIELDFIEEMHKQGGTVMVDVSKGMN